MPAVIGRKLVNTDLLLIPVCRTVNLSIFIFAENLDHNWLSRGGIAAVDPCFVKINVHVLTIAAIDIIICNRNGFNEICLARIILAKGIVKVMAGVITHFVDEVSITGRILVIQWQNDIWRYAAPVQFVFVSSQLPCISPICLCFIQGNPCLSVLIQNLFFSIRIHTVNRILNRRFIRRNSPLFAQYKPDRAAQRIRDLRDSGCFHWSGAIRGSNICDLIRVIFTVAVLDGKGISLIQRTILSSCGDIAAFADFVRHIGVEVAVFVGHRQITEGRA